jgi:hypothetical protein
MAGAQDESHRGSSATLSIRDALISPTLAEKELERLDHIIPTSVAVPGGLAFLTSSFEKLNACFRDVIAMERYDGRREWKSICKQKWVGEDGADDAFSTQCVFCGHGTPI